MASVADLQQSVERGRLDTKLLRETWKEVYKQAGRSLNNTTDIVGHPIVYCDCCGSPCFAAKTRSAYGGASWVCEETCLSKFAFDSECKTYILLDDVNNPTHVHDGTQNPGFIHFPSELPVAVYNADIMTTGAKFHKTPEEQRVLNSRKERSTDPERVFRNFGVELEVEKTCGGPPDLLSRTRKALEGFVLVKRDGSLSRHGNGGFEIVSAPATLAFHKGGIWNTFFKYLGPFFQEQPSTTGLHIHVGLNTLSPMSVNKLVLFVNAPENREFIFALANRNLLRRNPNGRLYAGVKSWGAGDMMRLKQHGNSCPWHPNNQGRENYYKLVNGQTQLDPFGNPIIATLERGAPNVRAACRCPAGTYNIEHYEAVNLRTHRPTVELRIFRGLVSEPFLYACLEFTDSLCDFVATVPITDLHYKNYLRFLEDKTRRYRNLYRLLVNQCWIDPPKDKKMESVKSVPAYGVYA